MIAAAALIMMSVFGSFILDGDPTVKQFGVGLSVGVALAALTVLLFAPAFLMLSGRVSWWVPQWADRLLPRAWTSRVRASRHGRRRRRCTGSTPNSARERPRAQRA